MTEPCQDSNVESAVAFLRSRSAVGVAKYGCTTDGAELDLVQWLQHMREELADALVYLTQIQRMLEYEKATCGEFFAERVEAEAQKILADTHRLDSMVQEALKKERSKNAPIWK